MVLFKRHHKSVIKCFITVFGVFYLKAVFKMSCLLRCKIFTFPLQKSIRNIHGISLGNILKSMLNGEFKETVNDKMITTNVFGSQCCNKLCMQHHISSCLAVVSHFVVAKDL